MTKIEISNLDPLMSDKFWKKRPNKIVAPFDIEWLSVWKNGVFGCSMNFRWKIRDYTIRCEKIKDNELFFSELKEVS